MPPGSGSSKHTDCTVQDQGRGSAFTPCGTTLMIAIRAEKLFRIIIGPGQIRPRIAGEASWPVTTGDLAEVSQRWGQCARRGLVSRHCAQESPEAPRHR